ncbi:hypothetical protein ACOSQ2_010421 [Xanthoceras sorbifolium]
MAQRCCNLLSSTPPCRRLAAVFLAGSSLRCRTLSPQSSSSSSPHSSISAPILVLNEEDGFGFWLQGACWACFWQRKLNFE